MLSFGGFCFLQFVVLQVVGWFVVSRFEADMINYWLFGVFGF